MRSLQNQMFVRIHWFRFILRGFAPQQKHDFIALLIDDLDNMACKLLPSAFGVGVGLAVLNCKSGVEKENTLFGPVGQVTMLWSF